jgi:16S rRNA (cytidine1402-2'-O)-methyltransferase
MKGKIYLIPTIIAEDTIEQAIPVHVRHVAASLDYFLAENIRTARRYLSALEIGKPIESLRFEQLDKNTSEQQIAQLLKPALEGKSVGILSEAGCPGVADPGALAVDYAHAHDIQVVPLVGPSSILMALMASGFNGQSFAFHGYLPIEKGKRGKAIKALEKDAERMDQTQIFMETPYRNNKLLEDLLSNLSPNTKLCVARDITGQSELVQTKRVGEWKNTELPDLHKVPTVFLLHHA